MAQPTFSVTTERVYSQLPDVYRETDANNGYQFKQYIASVTDQLGDIDLLIARFRYLAQIDREMAKRYAQRYTTYTHKDRVKDAPELGSTSDLVDPLSADTEWLPWIGQLVGVKITPAMGVLEARDAIAFASAGYRAGSKYAMEKAVRNVLSGSKYAVALPHTKVVNGNIQAGTVWDLTILTRAQESPPSEQIIAVLNKPTVKPAGIVLYHKTYQASWDALEAALPYWKDWETVSWDALEQIGLQYSALRGQILKNPSFEVDAANWTTAGAATQTRQPGGVDGSGQLRVDFSGTGDKATTTDRFSLDANKAYTTGITYKSTVECVLFIIKGETPVATVALPASVTQWKRVNTGFMPSTAGSDFALRVYSNKGTVNDNYTLDGAVVRDATS
jgi:hypothetical protein